MGFYQLYKQLATCTALGVSSVSRVSVSSSYLSFQTATKLLSGSLSQEQAASVAELQQIDDIHRTKTLLMSALIASAIARDSLSVPRFFHRGSNSLRSALPLLCSFCFHKTQAPPSQGYETGVPSATMAPTGRVVFRNEYIGKTWSA